MSLHHPGKHTERYISNTPKRCTVTKKVDSTGAEWCSQSSKMTSSVFIKNNYQPNRNEKWVPIFLMMKFLLVLSTDGIHADHVSSFLRFRCQPQAELHHFPTGFAAFISHNSFQVPGSILASNASMSQNDFSSSLVMMMRYPAMKFIPWNTHATGSAAQVHLALNEGKSQTLQDSLMKT